MGRCEGEIGDLVPLEEFDYHNAKLGCLLQESMDKIKFLGITVSDKKLYNLSDLDSLVTQ